MSHADAELIGFAPRAALERDAPLPQGFAPDPERRAYQRLLQHLDHAPRGPLETDPSRKQLIPYVIFTRGAQLWTMARTSAQHEARLHGRLSLGVGGHMERVDAGAEDPIQAATWRELHEELVLPEGLALQLVYRGILNDDDTPVGQVHLGIIATCALPPEATLQIREADKMTGQWWALEQLHQASSRLESWSALLLDKLPGWLAT